MMNLKNLPNCTPDEQVIYFLRRHPITLLGLAFGYLAFLTLPVIVLTLITQFSPTMLQDPTLFPLVVMGGSAILLLMWIFLFQLFLDYYLDVWIVTNKRILNIVQTGLFHRQVSEVRLYRIQDATASIGGILQTVLNFGKVEIQTAGEQGRFTFTDIPRPQEITKTILQLAEKDRAKSISSVVDEFEAGSSHGHAPRT